MPATVKTLRAKRFMGGIPSVTGLTSGAEGETTALTEHNQRSPSTIERISQGWAATASHTVAASTAMAKDTIAWFPPVADSGGDKRCLSRFDREIRAGD